MGMAFDDDVGPAVIDLVADAPDLEAVLHSANIEQDDVNIVVMLVRFPYRQLNVRSSSAKIRQS